MKVKVGGARKNAKLDGMACYAWCKGRPVNAPGR